MMNMCKSKKNSVFASIFKSKQHPSSSLPPPPRSTSAWPSCKNPRTESIRYTDNHNYFTDEETESISSSDESWEVELLVSDRLLFEGCGKSSMLVELKVDDGGKEEPTAGSPAKEGVPMTVESRDPYRDFRASMEEMVATLRLKEWERLEELLECYLRINGEAMHGVIREAFVDVVLEMVSSALSTYSSSSSSSSSSCSSAPNSPSFHVHFDR